MEDLQISKKLISEVLKIPLDVINEVYFDKTHLLVRKSNNRIEEHNIYEFAFKCKEWALKKGYMMKIENHYSDSIVIQIRKNTSKSSYIEPWKKTFKSEIEAIIKACEWILERSKCQN